MTVPHSDWVGLVAQAATRQHTKIALPEPTRTFGDGGMEWADPAFDWDVEVDSLFGKITVFTEVSQSLTPGQARAFGAALIAAAVKAGG